MTLKMTLDMTMDIVAAISCLIISYECYDSCNHVVISVSKLCLFLGGSLLQPISRRVKGVTFQGGRQLLNLGENKSGKRS